MCNLRPWDREDFLQCTAKRRIIMVGDMSMHQLFNSLACLLSKAIEEGSQVPWEVLLSSPTLISRHQVILHIIHADAQPADRAHVDVAWCV